MRGGGGIELDSFLNGGRAKPLPCLSRTSIKLVVLTEGRERGLLRGGPSGYRPGVFVQHNLFQINIKKLNSKVCFQTHVDMY